MVIKKLPDGSFFGRELGVAPFGNLKEACGE